MVDADFVIECENSMGIFGLCPLVSLLIPEIGHNLYELMTKEEIIEIRDTLLALQNKMKRIAIKRKLYRFLK